MTPLETLHLIFLLLLGLCIGSFLNVVVYRLPRECLSVAKGRSRCPRCGKAIAWFDNLPVLSWVLLGGKGRCCKTPIGVRYPLVELATGALFVGLGALLIGERLDQLPWGDAATGLAWIDALVATAIASALLALSLIDIDWRILPDELTLSGMVLCPLMAFAAPRLQPGEPLWSLAPASFGSWAPRLDALVTGIAGVALSAGVLYAVGWLGAKAFRKPAMGLGDVKMIGAMGGLLGAYALLALVVAAVLGTVVGLVILAWKRSRYIPFGPFLAAGMLIVMLFGESMWTAYRELGPR